MSKKTYKQLAKTYQINERTIRRKIDLHQVTIDGINAGECLVIMDTSYFGRKFGVMVFRDQYLRKNLLWKYVKPETLSEYVSGINELIKRGWEAKAIVCDGKRGLFKAFWSIPVQMC